MAEGTGNQPKRAHLTPSNLPPGSPPANHGKTAAAWVTMLVVTIGSLVVAVGVLLGSVPIGVAGGVVVVAGLVVGRVLRAMGFGQPAAPAADTPEKP